jgi:hypothetical protein
VLFSKHGKQLKPRDIVAHAKNKKAYLHRYFTWDVKQAAMKTWLREAGNIMRSVEYIVEVHPGVTTRLKVNVSVPSDKAGLRDSGDNFYMLAEDAVQVPDVMRRIKQKALADLKSWRDRYDMIKDLKPLFTKIDAFMKANP